MKLIDGIMGSAYQVETIDLPVQTERRLQALGMTEGTSVTVMNKKKRGAMVIKVRGTRFAVGKHIAEHIQIEEVQDR